MDEETILLPQEDQFEMLFPNASWNFKIENLFPPEASGNLQYCYGLISRIYLAGLFN